ncbi:MAG: hypothetical protein UH850_11795 [Paludibacteraceae bacterium]|nr:hypothetical protein [Paludibacteraceae bacterium]
MIDGGGLMVCLADEGSVIVGAYSDNHVFLIVPGGLYDVVDNENHMDKSGYILKYKDDPDISAGDRSGHSFAQNGRNHKCVNRILECGTNVKSDDAPVYAGMDWKGYKIDFINIRNLLNRLGKIKF